MATMVNPVRDILLADGVAHIVSKAMPLTKSFYKRTQQQQQSLRLSTISYLYPYL